MTEKLKTDSEFSQNRKQISGFASRRASGSRTDSPAGKRVMLFSLSGIPIGIAFCLLISLMMSSSQTSFDYVTPVLIERTGGNVISACWLQFLISALVGLIFGATGTIWNQERWSLSFQSALYLAVTAPTMLLAGWFCGWMPGSFAGIVTYCLIFLVIFVLIWLIGYLYNRASIRKLNRSLKAGKQNS